MYGNEPDRWDARLAGMERLRFVINVLTRLRVCTADGRVDISHEGRGAAVALAAASLVRAPHRASRDARVIFGHWSALGLVQRPGVIGLDTGCVWGGALTALDLDSDRPPRERAVRRLSARSAWTRIGRRGPSRAPGNCHLRASAAYTRRE